MISETLDFLVEFKSKIGFIEGLPRQEQLLKLRELEQELLNGNITDYDKKQCLKTIKAMRKEDSEPKKFKFKQITSTKRPENPKPAMEPDVTKQEPEIVYEVGDLTITEDQINLKNRKDSKLILDAKHSIMLSSLDNCEIYAKCHQFRVHELKNCRIYFKGSSIIIEDCSGLAISTENEIVDFSFKNDEIRLPFDEEFFNKQFTGYLT